MARLARLQLSDDEVSTLQGELAAILDYVAQLKEADVAGLKPTSQVTGLTNVLRPDSVESYGVDNTALLQNAPATESGYIKVKRVL